MSRSNMMKILRPRGRVVRLALLVALTSTSGLARGDNGPGEICRDASAGDPEIPVYPFAAEVQSSKVNSQSKRQAAARILGFSRPGNHSNTPHIPQTLPSVKAEQISSPSIVQTSTAEDVGSAQSTINLPRLPELRTDGTIPAIPSQLTQLPARTKSTARTVKEIGPVEHTLTDTERPREVQSRMTVGSDLVDDLVNSLTTAEPGREGLAESRSQFSDSINVQVATKPDDSNVSMSLSDRSAEEPLTCSLGDFSCLPQIMSMRDRVSEPTIAAKAGTPLQPYEQVIQVPTDNAAPASYEDATVQHAVSSRRDVSNTASSKAESRPTELPSGDRRPLVPMLASASGKGRPNSELRAGEPRALQPVPNHSTVTSAEISTGTQLPMGQQPLTLAPTKAQAQTQPLPAKPSPTQQVQAKEIRVSLRDSVNLQSTENIQSLSVEHDDICQIIQNGPKSCSVIGLREGQTRIAVISDVGGQRKVQVHNVIVNSSTRATAIDNTTLATEISQTVSQLFPRQPVRVSTRGTQLVVSGTVDTEDTAKKIISLVRKTTLTPVVDELKTK